MELGSSTGVPRNVRYRIAKTGRSVDLAGDWLDYGCGDGAYTVAIAKAGASTVTGIDIEPERLARAIAKYAEHEGVSWHLGTSETLPFADASFDGVFLNEVLEHVQDEAETLAELRRVLRPGGHLVVLSPSRYFPFEGHGMTVGPLHLDFPIPFLPWLPGALTRRTMRARNYWPGELRDVIADSGFQVVASASVFPVFEVFPWIPRRIDRWYVRNLARIERAPLIRNMGISTLVLARKGSRSR